MNTDAEIKPPPIVIKETQALRTPPPSIVKPVSPPAADDVDIDIDQEWEKPEEKKESKPVDRAKLGRLGTELYLMVLGWYDEETGEIYKGKDRWRKDAEPIMGELLEEFGVDQSRYLLYFAATAAFAAPINAARKNKARGGRRRVDHDASEPLEDKGGGSGPAVKRDATPGPEPIYFKKD